MNGVGLVVHHLAARVGHLEHRGVAVPDQVHLGPVDRQRAVDLQVVRAHRPAGLRGVAELRVERGRLPALRPGGDVAGVEPVQRDRERAEVGGGDEPAGIELIQRALGVGERGPLHEQPVGLVAEQPAQRDRDQHPEQGQVEQQVTDLPQVALLGRQPVLAGVVGPAEPEAVAGQDRRGHLGRLGRGQRGGVLGRSRQPGQVARRARRERPGRAGQPERPGYHAAHQGGEQQQVDGGEPGRGEDVEQPEVVQQRRECRVRRVVLLHAGRVRAFLRQHGSRHAAQGEQEEQDQRDPHRGELPPAPLQPVGEPERAARAVRASRPAVVLLGRRLERVRLRRTHIGHELPAVFPVTLARMSVSS